MNHNNREEATRAWRTSLGLRSDDETIAEQHSWAKLLREGGYKTSVAGKWHCNAKEPWKEHVGFDEYCMYEGADKIKGHFGIEVIASGQRKNPRDA